MTLNLLQVPYSIFSVFKVKPNSPENVTLQLDISEEIPTVHVRWESPHNTRFKSGWITLKYQLRVKHEDSEWNVSATC